MMSPPTPAGSDRDRTPPRLLGHPASPGLRRLGQEYLLVSIGQLGSLAVAVLSVKLLASTLSLAEYGRLGLAMTLCGLVGMLIFAPLGQVVDRFEPLYGGGGSAQGFRSAMLGVYLGAALLVAALSCIAALATASMGVDWSLLVVLAPLFAVLAGGVTLGAAFLNAHRWRARVALLLVGDGVLRLGAAVLLVLFVAPTATWALVGFLAGSLGSVAVAIAMGRASAGLGSSPHPSSGGREGHLGQSLRYAWPFSVQALFSAVALYSDRWVIGGVLGAADVGLYYVLVQFATAVVGIVAGPLVQFIQPVIYRGARAGGAAAGPGRSERILILSVWSFVLPMAIALPLVALFGPRLLSVLAPDAYQAQARLLWVVVLGVALFQTAQALALKAQIHRRPELNILPKMIHAVAMVGLGSVLVRWYGFAGVCVALVASSAIYLMAILAVNRALARPARKAFAGSGVRTPDADPGEGEG